MVSLLVLLVPLMVTLGLAAALAAAPASPAIDRAVTRAALTAFGEELRDTSDISASRAQVRRDRTDTLQAAHIPETYPVYASKSILYAAAAGAIGSVLGVYVVGTVIQVLTPSAIPSDVPARVSGLLVGLMSGDPSIAALFILLVVSSSTVGVVAGFLIYQLRWWYPGYVADERARRIDESLQRTTAFMFALARSGMPFTQVLRILADNQEVYGEAAREVQVAMRDMDMFGADMLDAVERMGRRSPSDEFGEFSENLASVLRSGQSLPDYLHEQHEQQREESELQQNQFLDMLATLAEGYVTVLVAGPLFLITILVIIGLVSSDTLAFLRGLVYVLIPLATVGMIAYVDNLSGPGEVEGEREEGDSAAGQWTMTAVRTLDEAESERKRAADGGAVETEVTDGGVLAPGTLPGVEAANRARLLIFDRLRPVRRVLRDPVTAVIERPDRVLGLTVPLTLVYLTWRAWPHLHLGSGQPVAVAPLIPIADDALVHAALFLTGTYAIVYEMNVRRKRAIEREVPDFLDRFASINDAGMPVVRSFARVVQSDLGALDAELERTVTDVELGTDLRTAFFALDNRLRSAKVTRAVTLITNAMGASGDIGPVLRIAADETQAARRLERERRQELFTYVIVIHISFLVFLAIIIALSAIFLPQLQDIAETTKQAKQSLGPAQSVVGGIGSLKDISAKRITDYKLLLFRATYVQAVCSGFVAGEMGDGEVRSGAKHAAIMIALAYVMVIVIG